jgi:hypothetical protein
LYIFIDLPPCVTSNANNVAYAAAEPVVQQANVVKASLAGTDTKTAKLNDKVWSFISLYYLFEKGRFSYMSFLIYLLSLGFIKFDNMYP